jgi:cytochrome c peroxidase
MTAKTGSSRMTQSISRIVGHESTRQQTDRQLLQRFSSHRDQEAFGALLRRHGSMVLNVCRGVLGNEVDAEDAFQATFLVLARNAAGIRKTSSVGSWLHGVAYRTALKARAQSAVRRKNEARAAASDVSGPDDLSWREIQEILHQELAGIAERYRVPLVACYLEGKTQDEAARQLGLAKSTLKERLERGRSLLRTRLVRRGLGPVAGLLAAAWPCATAPAQVPVALAASTIQAAGLWTAGQVPAPSLISTTALALTEGVLKPGSLAVVKTAALVTALAAVLAVGFGGATLATSGGAEPPRPAAAEKKPAEPSATRTLRLPETPYHYADVDLPPHFKTPAARSFDNTPGDNPVTDAGATLGRVLFYDTRLSANNTISCGSCHVQKNGFVDPNRFSKGFAGKLTDRHAVNLTNLRYQPSGRFFWDERSSSLEDAVLVPIRSKAEMGRELSGVVEMLGKDERYARLFASAFGDGKATPERVGKALAQFLRSMVSCRSKYDEGLVKVKSVRDDFPNFTTRENRGKAIFLSNCAFCHLPGQEAHFSMFGAANDGLDEDYKHADGGVGDITLDALDVGRFKPPSLRNVEVAAPYMHDGRFDTLEKVIDHYSKGVRAHPNLDPRMRQRNPELANPKVAPRQLNFTDSEKRALVDFLKTLTDHTFLTDPRFSDPFR